MKQAEIKTKLTADGSELSRALKQGVAQGSDFAASMRNVGKAVGAAFTVHAVVNFTRELALMADGIQDAAGALELSTDELQSFDAAARKTAGGVEGFRAAMKKLAEVQADAREKGGAAKETFDRLGLGADGYTASLSAVIKATADYYARTGDLSTVQDLLGRSAVTTREALDEIAQQSLPEFVNKMKDAGLVIESEGIKKMAEFNLMLEEGKVKMAGWGVNFVRNMSDAVKGWNMIRKAMLDGTGMGISDLSPEEMERFMGLGERARLRERPGVGSIQERVASQAEQKASKAMKDLETAELKQAQLVADTQEAGSSMLQFLSVVKSGESQMMQEAADRMRKESESLFNFVMAIGDPSQGLSGAREQRFSDLRRIGANEFGTGTTANKALDESQKSRAALEKLVTLIPQLPPNIASAIGTIRGIF